MTHLLTVAQVKVAAAFATIWFILDLLLGGIDTPIKVLAGLIAADFITGVYAGWRTDTLSSKVGANGLRKKAGVFVCIMIAYALDVTNGMSMFRGMVISGFAIIEAMSILENIDRMGYGYIVPDFIRDKLTQVAKDKQIKGE